MKYALFSGVILIAAAVILAGCVQIVVNGTNTTANDTIKSKCTTDGAEGCPQGYVCYGDVPSCHKNCISDSGCPADTPYCTQKDVTIGNATIGMRICTDEKRVVEEINYDFDASCDSSRPGFPDYDCMLTDKSLDYSTCWPGACEDLDYSKDSWIGVNAGKFYEFRKKIDAGMEEKCGPRPGCANRGVNTDYEAKCINNFCKKVSKDISNNEACAQNNYGKTEYCVGIPEGANVPSCDCNTCACIKMQDGKLYPSCTEKACGASNTWTPN